MTSQPQPQPQAQPQAQPQPQPQAQAGYFVPALGFGDADAGYRSAHAAAPAWSAASFGRDESVDVRCNAIVRMREANLGHAELAWQRRRARPLSPYALGLLYTYPDTRRRGRHSVAAATRVWKQGPESESMAHLLYNYHLYLQQLGSDGLLDVRTQMTYVDAMPDGAAYTGIGLSSLDTHTGTWQQVLRTAEYVDDVPGRIFMIMSGGVEPGEVLIVCSRRGRAEFDTFNVQSTRRSEIERLSTGRLWPANREHDSHDDTVGEFAAATAEQLMSNPRNAAFTFLRPLHETLCRLDNTRLAAPAARPYRTGGHGR